jgi:hypothetical protein
MEVQRSSVRLPYMVVQPSCHPQGVLRPGAVGRCRTARTACRQQHDYLDNSIQYHLTDIAARPFYYSHTFAL